MSTKSTAMRGLVQAFKAWPADSNRVYASFKEFQVEKLNQALKGPESKLPSADAIERQVEATRLLISDSNNRKFPVGEKMKAPQGMPNYYQRITREADRGLQKKESFVTSFREAAFGWFK